MTPQQARLNVRIDQQLLQEARVKAIRTGTNLSQIVRDLLIAYVQAPAPDRTIATPAFDRTITRQRDFT